MNQATGLSSQRARFAGAFSALVVACSANGAEPSEAAHAANQVSSADEQTAESEEEAATSDEQGVETEEQGAAGKPGREPDEDTDDGTDPIIVANDAGHPGKEGDDCGGYRLETQVNITPGNVLVIFDQSNTMGEPWVEAGFQPKHFVAGDALMKAIAPIKDQVVMGSIFFPTSPAPTFLDLCPAGVAPLNMPPQIGFSPGGTFMNLWAQHFAPPWSTVLGTPLNKALHEADAALQTPPPGITAVVIFTDGHWTCPDGTEVATVANLLARGIKTYMVGLPGAYGIAQLDQIAAAGGTAAPGCTANCFLLPTNPAELETQLAAVATKTVSIESCTFQFPKPPPNDDDVHLVVGEGATTSELPPDGGKNWTLAPDGKSATLQGPTCDKAKSGGYASLEFIFGCPDAFIIR